MDSFAWFIARRYLTARRRQAFISLISAVSIVGVGVGVMALVIALALMTGVQTELRDRIVGSTAHVYVFKRTGAFLDLETERTRMRLPGVTGVAPAILGAGLAKVSSTTQPIQIKGVDPTLELEVTDLRAYMIEGSIEGLVKQNPDARDPVLLGADLAQALGVGVGDVVDVVVIEVQSTLFGGMPRIRALQVAGIFRFGFYAIDTSQALVHLDLAADLLNRDGADMMQLRLSDIDAAPALRAQLEADLGHDYQIQDWTILNAPLYSALWLEKLAISLTIGLIVIVAALNIVASLVLLVMEKSRDIAILRTMGASASVIRRIFVLQGLTIGLIGTASGTILGLAISLLADKYRWIRLPADVYQIPYLPFRIQLADVGIVVISAVVVCLVATLYPSRQAGRIDPAEALRNQ